MIGYMGSQQRKQLEGLEELAAFTSKESELFTSSTYPFLLEHVHQSLAKATLASQWLNEDVTVTGNAQYQDRVISLLSALESNKVQVRNYCYLAGECLLTCNCLHSDLVAAVFAAINGVSISSCSKTHMLTEKGGYYEDCSFFV